MPEITLTDVAKTKLEEYLSEEPTETVVRILVEDDGKYGLSLDTRDDGDVAFSARELSFVVEKEYGEVVEGLRIDYLDQGASSGFSLTGGKPPAKKVVLRSEETPNPDARKFVLAFSLGAEGRTWTPDDAEGAAEPIQRLLALPEVVSVFQLGTFVTVTRTAGGAAWDALTPQVSEVLSQLEKPALAATRAFGDSDSLPDRLARFIESDVAPFLRQDGGDIELVAVEDDGIVKVKLVGACGTCPSSVMTLRMGVERRLQAAFPEEIKGLELVESAAV